MNDRARKHTSRFIDEFMAAQAPIAAASSAGEAVGPDQFLDVLDLVDQERDWLRSHRAEWAAGDTRPWNLYRILLLELHVRLVELVEVTWDMLAAQRSGDEGAQRSAMETRRRSASRAGAAVQGLIGVQEAMGATPRGH